MAPLESNQQEFIKKRVISLGSIESVKKEYNTNSEVDRYANELAVVLFGSKKNEKRSRPNKIANFFGNQDQLAVDDQSITTQNEASQALFPDAFLAWSGSRDAVVKRPFEKKSGRPTGKIIKTNLIKKLSIWAKDLIAGNNVPNALFLIGGPGNGKTDAVEFALHEILKQIHGGDEALLELTSKFTQADHLPRQVFLEYPISKYEGIMVVQDATIQDIGKPDKTADELLLEDFKNFEFINKKLIYLFCINRGILSQTITTAHQREKNEKILELLNTISKAVTTRPDPISAWPLKNFPHIAVWPMDVESIVDTCAYSGEKTPVHKIIEDIIVENRWHDHSNCDVKEFCPFAYNQQLLSKESIRDNLIKILYFYELSTGKRWNFREIFSLISLLMVGQDSDYTKGKKNISLCDWVKNQSLNLSPNNHSKRKDRIRSAFNLSSKLYYHALFPKWPKLGKIRYSYSHNLKKKFESTASSEYIDGFFSILSLHKRNSSSIVARIINDDFSENLDPAVYTGDRPATLTGETSISTIEELFSHSVLLGKKSVAKMELSKQERILLDCLLEAEKAIEELAITNKKDFNNINNIHSALKIFSCRFVKRSLAVRNGTVKNIDIYEDYSSTLHDRREMSKLRRMLEKLINKDAFFEMSLVTTFGQPEPSPSRNAILRSPKISIRIINNENLTDRPYESLQYFRILNNPIPLTFNLFAALINTDKGLEAASLPGDIFALLNCTKSGVLGQIVRDVDLVEDTEIFIGETGEVIHFDHSSGFSVTRFKGDI